MSLMRDLMLSDHCVMSLPVIGYKKFNCLDEITINITKENNYKGTILSSVVGFFGQIKLFTRRKNITHNLPNLNCVRVNILGTNVKPSTVW